MAARLTWSFENRHQEQSPKQQTHFSSIHGPGSQCREDHHGLGSNLRVLHANKSRYGRLSCTLLKVVTQLPDSSYLFQVLGVSERGLPVQTWHRQESGKGPGGCEARRDPLDWRTSPERKTRSKNALHETNRVYKQLTFELETAIYNNYFLYWNTRPQQTHWFQAALPCMEIKETRSSLTRDAVCLLVMMKCWVALSRFESFPLSPHAQWREHSWDWKR